MNPPLKSAAAKNSMTLTLPVDGMNCASSVGQVETALRAVPGVTEATLNLPSERAVVTGARLCGDGPFERVRSEQCAASAALSAHASVRRQP